MAGMAKPLARKIASTMQGRAVLQSLPWWRNPSAILDGVVPGFAADFVRGRFALNGRPAAFADLFTLSSGAKLVVDASGALVQVAANAPAFDWSTGRCWWLVEGAATNLFWPSQNLTAAGALVVSGATLVGGAADPTGGAAASTLTATATNGQAYNGFAGATSGSPYTSSIYIRRRAGSGIIRILSPAVVWHDIPITAAWTRISWSDTVGSSLARLGIQIATAGDAVDIFGAQIEAGSVPTSYIPTTTGAVTRTADDARPTAAALAQITSPAGGTIAVRGACAGLPAYQRIVGTDGAGSAALLFTYGSGQVAAHTGATEIVATLGSGTMPEFGAAVALSGAATRLAVNGGAVASGAAMAAFTALRIGAQVSGSSPVSRLQIDEIMIWSIPGSDAGLRTQARRWS